MNLFLIVILFGSLTFQVSLVQADDVLDAAEEAIKLYKEGKYSEAAGNFEYAGQLARQKRSGQLSDYLPAALDGWEAEEVETQAVAAGMFGVTSAERTYTKGDSSITVSIMADSPMIQGMIMMLQNPMIAASQGGELIKVDGRKALLQYDAANKSGQVQLVAANQYFIQVEGSQAEKEDVLKYAVGVNYGGLEEK